MEKKLLSILFLASIFFLNPIEGFGQCPTSVSISSDAGNTICAGTPVTFSATANGGTNLTFQWQINDSDASTGTSFSSSTLTNGDKIKVIVTSSDDPNCSKTSSVITMTVNANKTPTVTISASKSSICPEESVTFTANNTNGGTSPQYSFFLNSNNTVLQSGSSNTFTTTTLNDGDQIRVMLTSSLDCTTSDTADVLSNSIEVRPGTPVQPGTISAAETAICPGISQTYSIAAVTGASSYQWTLPSGWSGSSSSTSINATAGTTGGTISVKAINDCGTGEAETIDITVKAGTPAAPASISGETAVCPGVSQTYSITDVANATEYIWTLPSGWSGTSTTNSITVTTGASGSGNISVQAKNDCGTSTAKTLTVPVKPGTPAQPGTISGTAEVCPGTQHTYSITAVAGATSYAWTLPNSDWTGTSTTNSITVTSGTTGGNLTVKAINDCGTGPERILALTVKPGTPATPEAFTAGPTEVCPGTSATYTVPAVTGATQYVWTLPTGFSAANLTTTTPSLVVNAGASGSGNISVRASNDCGTSSTARTMAITVGKATPATPGTITGNPRVCATATGLVYSIQAVTNATEYIWTLPTGSTWAITGGQGTTSITVTAGETTSSNNTISVVAKNSCGTSSSQNLSVTAAKTVPAKPGDISTDLPTAVICPPVNGIKFWVPEVSGMAYKWHLPNGFEITSGAGTSLIIVNITTNAAFGSNIKVEVEAVNSCGPSLRSSYSNINLDKFVVTNLGEDKTFCSSTTMLNLSGNIAFGTGNTKLKITSITSTGNNQVQGIPNGPVNDFTYQYTPSSQDLAAGKVTFTLTTEKPAGSCAAGTDQMTVFFKALPTATISSTEPICSGNTSTITFTGTPNSRVTYKLPNNTTQTIDLPASGAANVTTAPLTSNATYTLVSSINLDTPACSNTLTASTTITVTPKPTATITYAGASFCSTDNETKVVTLTGSNAYTGGSYSSNTGLTINASTGAITPSTSTPGTYTVTYKTIEDGGCIPVTATTQVTISKAPTVAISYAGAPFCTSDTSVKTATLTGTDGFPGGIFSAPEGLTINSSTGAITANTSTAGTYLITYKTPNAGGCTPVSTTTEVIITNPPTATISYPDAPFCLSDGSQKAVTLTGTDAFTGGKYSAAPSGLSINETSGAITPSASTAGTYEITYTVPATAGCGEVTATTEVTITQTPTVDISYDGPFCTADETAQSVNFTNGIGAFEGGIFSSTPGGLKIDPSTGDITPKTSTPGTYTVSYTIPATSGCDAVVVETEIKITLLPQVSISYETPLCNSDDTIAVSYNSTFGDYTGGIFSATAGLVIDAEGNIDSQTSTPGSHTVTYTKDTEGDGCNVIEVTTQVEIFEKVQITTQPVNFGTCSSNPASFEVVAIGDNLQYQWYKKDAGGTFVKINGETNATLSFNNATSANSGEYHVVVSSSNAVCASETSDPVTLNIDEDIVIIKPAEDITICEDDYEFLSFDYEAHANGAELTFQWIKDGNPINEVAGKYVMTKSGPSGPDGLYIGTLTIQNIDINDDGIYAVKIDGPDYFTCSEATSKTFTFRVNKRPDKPVTASVEYCLNATPTALTATKASADNELLWYSYDATSTEYTYLGTSVTPTTDAAGTTSYWVTQKQPNSCESDPAELVVTVYDKPQPIATETIQFSYCFNETVTDPISLTPADGSTLNWYDAENATTALSSAPTPNTSEVKLTSYWVSQTLTSTGCESERTKVDIIINELPNINIDIAEGYSAEICQLSETKLIASGATSYVWYFEGNEIGTSSEITVLGENTGTFEYKVVGTDDNGCVNENVISIKVEEPSEGGMVSGPSSVCVTQNEGTLTVADFKGEIQRWESSTDGANWTAIAQTSETLDFQNISGTTTFRAIVQNGVCEEVASTEIAISIDQEPVGGELAFEGFGRVLETCSNPGSNYSVPINLTGETGTVVRWRYIESSNTSWSTVMDNGNPFTGNILTAELIKGLGINQTTIFEVEIASGACTPNVFSQNATLSIISSDIAPNPVTVSPGVVCAGEFVTLSASSGYGNGSDVMSGGDFNSGNSLTNEGWRVRRDGSTTDLDFPAGGNNTRPNIWINTNDQPFYTANINNPDIGSDLRWDSGDKKFAIVAGNNPSTLETPVFNTYAMESATFTFDQAYNLTVGAKIMVEISTDGGATYPTILYESPTSPTKSDRIGDFGLSNDPRNKISIDLSSYLGQPNLRIRFHFIGTQDGDVWTIDGISIPEGPTGVEMIWTDYTDPTNPVIIGTNNSEQWEPTLIGWNDFEIRTKLTFDSIGAQCPVVENFSTIKVFVFDQYTSTAIAVAGSCGNNNVQLNGVILNSTSTEVTTFPTRDDYTARWEVVSGPDSYTFSETHFTNSGDTTPAINDPAAIFSPGVFGSYTLRWALNRPADDSLKNETCPPIYTDVTIEINDCTTLDFDGEDDRVEIQGEYEGAYSLEAWVRPEAENGTIISKKEGHDASSAGYELYLNNGKVVFRWDGGVMSSASTLTPNTRWYHVAVSFEGNAATLYIDGISAGDRATGNGLSTNIQAPFLIGASYNSSNKGYENHFSGWIEEVRIWNGTISPENIRFTMNQRLKGTGNIGEVVDMVHPDAPDFADLAGYYRLISAEPDPINLVTHDANLLPTDGTTIDLALNSVPGVLKNMETNQENTAPLPYISGDDGSWDTSTTWARPTVWNIPNTNSINWNIVRLLHNVNSPRDIEVLGIDSQSGTLDMLGTIPSGGSHTGVGTGNALTISHYLKLDGIIDLNGESQLLQPDLSIVDPASSGHLDRDQQGKRNSFIYNYWASPVSISGPNTANNGGYSVGGVLLDGTNPAAPASITFPASHAAADGTRSTPLTISAYWLWKFSPATANAYSEWKHIGSTGTVRSGEGFTMKGTDGNAILAEGQNYTFRGKPHNGDIILSMEGNQNYLIGNPYPSAMDANQFITDNGTAVNPVFDGSIYFWDHFTVVDHILKEYIGGYATYNLTGGVSGATSSDERINDDMSTSGKLPQRYIPVGQGFMINSTDPVSDNGLGGDLTFKNSYRAFKKEVKDNSIFLRPEVAGKKESKSSDFTKIRLSYSSPIGYHRQILVGAIPTATDGFDLGYDAHLFDDNIEDMYWLQGNNKLVIQAIADFNKDRVIPLGIKVKENKEFRIRLDTLENGNEEINIYLNDKLKDSIHDLRKSPYFSTSEPGTIHDRFEIIFFKDEPVPPVVEVPGEEPDEIKEEFGITVRHGQRDRELQILNPYELSITNMYIFDLNGNKLEGHGNLPVDKEFKMPVRNYSSGVYIVQLVVEGRVVSKKIIINN